jgi:hypothetical protein
MTSKTVVVSVTVTITLESWLKTYADEDWTVVHAMKVWEQFRTEDIPHLSAANPITVDCVADRLERHYSVVTRRVDRNLRRAEQAIPTVYLPPAATAAPAAPPEATETVSVPAAPAPATPPEATEPVPVPSPVSGHIKRCSNCKSVGHNRAGCPNRGPN